MEKLISISETAEWLGVSTQTVRRLIADGDLPASRIGRRTIRINPADVRSLAPQSVTAG